MNKPNRKKPSTALTHSRLADYTNLKDIKPRLFIPNKPVDPLIIACFSEEVRKGSKPFIAYSTETGLFTCHGFTNGYDNQDCMHILLEHHLVPYMRTGGVYERNLRFYIMYIPPERLLEYQHRDYRAAVLPESAQGVMRPHEFKELKILKVRRPYKPIKK